MIVLRSFLSNLSLYAIITLGCILAVPLLLFPENVILKHIFKNSFSFTHTCIAAINDLPPLGAVPIYVSNKRSNFI